MDFATSSPSTARCTSAPLARPTWGRPLAMPSTGWLTTLRERRRRNDHGDHRQTGFLRERGEISRTEEHTYEGQARMSISYAVFCMKKKKRKKKRNRRKKEM